MAYVIVDGAVENVFYEGKGLRIKESFKKRDGSEGAAYFSAFTDTPHGLSVGDKGTFKGNLSVKTRTYTNDQGEERTTADVTINNLKFEASSDGPF